MSQLDIYTGGPVETNGYIITSAENPNEVLVIDAPEGIADYLAAKKFKVKFLLITHQHYDHVSDAAALQQTGAKLISYQNYSKELTLEAYGLPMNISAFSVDQLVADQESIKLSPEWKFAISWVPGHATDHITFYQESEQRLFCGDTLFTGSVGRTDLPGGSHAQLISKIEKHLMVLPEATQTYSGHGPSSTIAIQKQTNPYFKEPTPRA